MIASLIFFLLVGLLLIALGIPFIKAKVPPNSWYGLRVGETLQNDEVWYEANRFSGRDLIGFGLLTMLLAVVLAPFLRSHLEVYFGVLSLFEFVGVLILAGRGMSEARKISKRINKK